MRTETKKRSGRAEVVARMMQRTAVVMDVDITEIMAVAVGGRRVSRARNTFCHLVYPIMDRFETAAILGRRTHSTIYGAQRRCLAMMLEDHDYCVDVMGLLDEFKRERALYKREDR